MQEIDCHGATAPSPHWPPGVPRDVTPPATHLFCNAEAAARRHPHKPFMVCGQQSLTFLQFCEQAQAIAAWLQHAAGVKCGDRVLLALHSGPHWALACYAILRADAVMVPLHPRASEQELHDRCVDSGAMVAFVSPGCRAWSPALAHVIVAPPGDDSPGSAAEPAQRGAVHGVTWDIPVAAGLAPLPMRCGPDDPAVMPYTSGSTGQAKGCVHTHRSVMSALVAGAAWFSCGSDAVFLATLPFFHVTGFTGSLNIPLFVGATVVVLTRWSRAAAAELMQRHRVTHWHCITSMVVDLLAYPRLSQFDLRSLRSIRGGGAAMPQAVAQRLKARTGLDYIEGYGLSETMAATHLNPPHRPKPQCLGLPLFGVDARIIDPHTLRELPRGASGEIVIHAPQLLRGYWRQPQADAAALLHIEGKRFLRTGDLGRVDEEGYFFMTDRLKRMINHGGLKVWPAEVEALLYRHPAVQETCVVATPHARRGETVKALVVRRADFADVDGRALMHWTRQHLAAYKCPRVVEFVASLPRSDSGKLLWRALQEREFLRAGPDRGSA
nr:long-chain-fatty-acid--CoA ligase [Azohydromonas aeria]